MSKFSSFLISRLIPAVLATGIVITQTDLTTATVLSPENEEVNNQELIYQGLAAYSKICLQAYYNPNITGKKGN